MPNWVGFILGNGIIYILTEGLEGSEGRSWLKLWGSKEGQSPSRDPMECEISVPKSRKRKRLRECEREGNGNGLILEQLAFTGLHDKFGLYI